MCKSCLFCFCDSLSVFLLLPNNTNVIPRTRHPREKRGKKVEVIIEFVLSIGVDSLRGVVVVYSSWRSYAVIRRMPGGYCSLMETAGDRNVKAVV